MSNFYVLARGSPASYARDTRGRRSESCDRGALGARNSAFFLFSCLLRVFFLGSDMRARFLRVCVSRASACFVRVFPASGVPYCLVIYHLVRFGFALAPSSFYRSRISETSEFVSLRYVAYPVVL